MEQHILSGTRYQSEKYVVPSKIVSPAPIRKTSKISFNIARELFDLPSSVEETDSNSMNPLCSSFFQTKFLNLRNETDSPK